jgi:hypothetical protein
MGPFSGMDSKDPIPEPDPAEGKPLYIVPCSGTKNSRLLQEPLPARIAYNGQAFLAARKFLEAQGFDWIILSAKFGFLLPTQEIPFYNFRFNKSPIPGQWEEIKASMDPEVLQWILSYDRHVVLGGRLYSEHAAEILGKPVERPLLGLKLGEQVSSLQRGAWYKGPIKVASVITIPGILDL